MDANIAGGRSTRIAKGIMDIFWWLSLAATVTVTIVLFLGPALMKARGIAPKVQLEVELEHGRALEALPLRTSDTLTASAPVLTRGEATLQFRTTRPGLLFMGLLSTLPGVLAFLLGVGLLRSILRDVRKGEVFTAANARRVSWLGWLLVVAGILIPIVETVRAQLIVKTAGLSGVTLGPPSHRGEWSLAIPGLLVLVLAAAWRHGVELQRDRDLTV